MTEIENVKLPSLLWKIIVSLAGLSVVLLASFFSWLGITAVQHTSEMARQGNRLQTIETIVYEIDDKIDMLPPASVLEMPIIVQEVQRQVADLKADAEKREHQLDAVERRVDQLETSD